MTSRGATIGKRVKLLQGIWVDRFSNLEIGDNVSLARGITLVSAGGITIGDRTMVGHGSKLISAAHSIPKGRKPMRFSELVFKKIIIENDVWIGAQAVILPGVTVGEGAVVGAGAVVTKNVSPFAIVGGVPAKLIRMRD
ncbi:MAG: acyltransferase [Desulfobacterales bacterium]|nr:acyltransferase [Desulfobacterales bacterium]